jgi:hypothetical protein
MALAQEGLMLNTADVALTKVSMTTQEQQLRVVIIGKL